jgi:hypothetical protein
LSIQSKLHPSHSYLIVGTIMQSETSSTFLLEQTSISHQPNEQANYRYKASYTHQPNEQASDEEYFFS